MLTNALDVLGHASTLIVLGGAIFGVYSWITGILPVIYRLGKGLANRKIAVFAEGSELSSLENLLLDSNLFRTKNIIGVTSQYDLGRAEDASVFLVVWDDWKNDIDQILTKKRDKTPMIVYAPLEKGALNKEDIQKISVERNSTVTNFRGRLLNDVINSMITTSL